MKKKFKLFKIINDNNNLLLDNNNINKKFKINIDDNNIDKELLRKFNINMNDNNNIIKYKDIKDGKIIDIENKKDNMKFNIKRIDKRQNKNDKYFLEEIRYIKNDKDNLNNNYYSTYNYSYLSNR